MRSRQLVRLDLACEGRKLLILDLAADWYNYAAAQDRQVVRNNRCGSNQTDFVTPEYATFSAQLVSAVS